MKRGPIIFILLLVSMLVFILGVQYGKKVNIADEALSIFLSITPSLTPSVSLQPDATYDVYRNETCGISFLYPSSLQLRDASSEASLFSSNQSKILTIKCLDQLAPSQKPHENIATSSVELQKFSIVGEELEQKEGTYIKFSQKHPYNGRIITAVIRKSLLPLIEKTFEFIP